MNSCRLGKAMERADRMLEMLSLFTSIGLYLEGLPKD
jgi:hypothetical protein